MLSNLHFSLSFGRTESFFAFELLSKCFKNVPIELKLFKEFVTFYYAVELYSFLLKCNFLKKFIFSNKMSAKNACNLYERLT